MHIRIGEIIQIQDTIQFECVNTKRAI